MSAAVVQRAFDLVRKSFYYLRKGPDYPTEILLTAILYLIVGEPNRWLHVAISG